MCCVKLAAKDDDEEDHDRNGHYGSIQVVLPINRYTSQFLRPFNTNSAIRGKPNETPEVSSIDTDTNKAGFKQSLTCGTGPIKTLTYDEQRLFGQSEADKNSWPGTVSQTYF